MRNNMGELKPVAILIPIHNRIDNIIPCLEALSKSNYRNYQIIVIDDGSTDGSGDHIRKNYPDTVLILGDGNLWWAGAINKGIAYATEMGFDYVLTYNDDQVCHPDFLKALMRHADHDTILSSLILYQSQPDRILSSGILFDYNNAKTRGYRNEQNRKELPENPYTVDASPGYCLLMPMQVLKMNGSFNEVKFPQINMELEFCLRMQRNGVAIKVVPDSIVWNDRSDKSGDPIAYCNPFVRLKWFAGSVKSDLSFRQARHSHSMLAEYLQGNRLLFFGRHWLQYVVKLSFKSLFPKPVRKRLTGLVKYNKDAWA